MNAGPLLDPPRILDLLHGGFNFTVTLEDRVRALAGAPAFIERKRRVETGLSAFWETLDARAAQIDVAAAEGRIAEDGREWAPVLLDDEGRDPIAERAHARALYRARTDPADDHREAWNRGWGRHVQRIAWGPIQQLVEDGNRWFPVEANLPVSPETDRYLWLGLPWSSWVAPSVADVFQRHPLR